MSENMLFCLGSDKFDSSGEGYQKNYRIFNQDVEKSEWEKIKNSLPSIELKVSSWIDKKDMSKEEKNSVSGWDTMGGYLKTLFYEEAWAKWWSEAKQEDKNKILNIPQFDAKIFTDITGLKDFATRSLKGKTVKVEIDGESYTAIVQ